MSEVKDPIDGVVSREDMGDGIELVRGMRGEVSVVVDPSIPMTAELQQKVNDIIIENSSPGKHEDARHSSHPDFQAPDGTYMNRKSEVSESNADED